MENFNFYAVSTKERKLANFDFLTSKMLQFIKRKEEEVKNKRAD